MNFVLNVIWHTNTQFDLLSDSSTLRLGSPFAPQLWLQKERTARFKPDHPLTGSSRDGVAIPI